MSTTKPKPVAPADDFTEDTPPPKTRPVGEPVARRVELPPGEPVLELFRSWDRAGRIPPGCVLAEIAHTPECWAGKASGYKLLAGALPGCVVGKQLSHGALDGFTVRVEILAKAGRFPEVSRTCVVFAPKGGVR